MVLLRNDVPVFQLVIGLPVAKVIRLLSDLRNFRPQVGGISSGKNPWVSK